LPSDDTPRVASLARRRQLPIESIWILLTELPKGRWQGGKWEVGSCGQMFGFSVCHGKKTVRTKYTPFSNISRQSSQNPSVAIKNAKDPFIISEET